MNRGIGLRVVGVAIAVAAIRCLFTGAKAEGQTVNFYITTTNATSSGGTWQVYADVSKDNDGLTAYDIDVIASGGASVAGTPKIMRRRPVDPSNQYREGSGGRMGFGSSFDDLGTLTNGSRFGMIEAQTTVYSGTDDPNIDMGVFVGVGQEDWSASPQNGTEGPIDGSGVPTGITTPVWTYLPYGYYSGGNILSYPVAGALIEQGSYTSNGAITAAIGSAGGFGVSSRSADHGWRDSTRWNELSRGVSQRG